MTVANYTVVRATTDGVATDERADFWTEHVRGYHCRMDIRGVDSRGNATFAAGTIRQATATFQMVEFWSDRVAYVRTPGQVRRFPDANYRFLLPLSGGMAVRAGETETPLEEGVGSLLPGHQPFQLRQGASARGVVLTIPEAILDGPRRRSGPPLGALNLRSGLGRVVGDMVRDLAAERDHLTARQFDAVCDRVAELLCILAEDAPPHPLEEVEAVARRFVRRHAADPDLTVASLARSLGWSVRQLQLAMQQADTTPSELIREERLRRAREMLRAPGGRANTLDVIAHDSGFASADAMRLAFKRRFGVSPSEVRDPR
ncbi:helix-turn-helix domain-containing protein [Euzebya rosea]|uniref:helix-turn-helix domain-containing protein n=1 Tax=Euzebya rosea TaxID=2052804 RepID=UPI000D3EA1B5|nr:helix-turn-helix domain-containing protein [Euzebya rosea]